MVDECVGALDKAGRSDLCYVFSTLFNVIDMCALRVGFQSFVGETTQYLMSDP
jgi:hypothetical protein